MLRGEVPATPEQMQKFIKTIVENEARLHRLVDDMRRLLSLERGTSPVRHERVQVAEVLMAVTDKLNLRLQEEHRQINVILQIAEPVPDIAADGEKLYEGIRRLADNALDFTEDGGLINLSAYRSTDTDMVIIHIEDTGIGIAKEEAHRVYERFFRGDHEAALRIRGNGLGLSVAQAYIEVQGGTIGFESEVGKGTIFHVIIPIYQPQ
jgi:signal transduction histidine kinase